MDANSISDLLLRYWRHLSGQRQRQLALVFGLMLLSGFAEVVSLGAVLPFLGILAVPDRVFHHPMMENVCQALGVTSAEQLVVPLTVAFIMAVLIAGAIRLTLLWVDTRLSYAIGQDISSEIYRRTLYQPYQVHVMRNSSEVISAITNKSGYTTHVLGMLLVLVSSILMVVFVMGALIAINPLVSIAIFAVLGISYALIVWLVRQRLKNISQRLSLETTKIVQLLQEGLGSIRDVLLDGLQQVYCERYRQANKALLRAHGNKQIIGSSPHLLMEMMGMTVIAALAYSLSRDSGGMAAALPLLGVIALGAQRLLPAIQKIYMAWTAVVSSRDILADVLVMLDQPIPEEALKPVPAPLKFQKEISFDKVRFRYTEDSAWVLDGLDLRFDKGIRVGFVGSTGCGKSTLIDLLMGLLMPTEGQVIIDGQELSGECLRAWHQTIAHVPQSVFLTDRSLAENIAFGLPPEAIDMDRVRRAAQQAQLADFIESRKDGYKAVVGERGIRLSGGQRQRIGVARALYKDATVLVFDEATSALDAVTERAVMEAIDSLNRDLTVFLIAHRITTVENCDVIVMLENGKVAAHGSYQKLIERSPAFRKMAALVNEKSNQ